MLFYQNIYNNNNFNCCSGGEFGAMMKVSIENDGPVTLEIESPQLPPCPKRLAFLYQVFQTLSLLVAIQRKPQPPKTVNQVVKDGKDGKDS